MVRRWQRSLVIDSLIMGVVGAGAARIFSWLLDLVTRYCLQGFAGYTAPGLPNEGGVLQQSVGAHGLWLIPVVITLGGLVSGALVYWIAPEAEGHGTDTVVKAFHRLGGRIRARVTPLKIVTSALTIGTGGAAGREGPTALFSAGIGSMYAGLNRRTARERRLLVLIGCAAGLSAIFRSPIGTALFAIEVLYEDMEYEADALLYTLISSIVAYTITGFFVDWQPLFQVPAGIRVTTMEGFASYIGLGVLSGVVGLILPNVFYGGRDLFHRIPIPPHFKPAVGALGVGLMALGLPEVLGGGYGWIQEAMNGQLALSLLALLIVGKILAFTLTVGSGGSGGVFAPSLFIGAMTGGALAHLFQQPPAPFVIVGMAAVFGSAGRVPIATLLMVTEMTGGYHLLAPAALGVSFAYLVQAGLGRLLPQLPYTSLYEAQVANRYHSPAHHADTLRHSLQYLAGGVGRRRGGGDAVSMFERLVRRRTLTLPDGYVLLSGRLRDDSPCVGTMVKRSCLFAGGSGGDIIYLVREGKGLRPYPTEILREGDLIMILAPQEDLGLMHSHLVILNLDEAAADPE